MNRRLACLTGAISLAACTFTLNDPQRGDGAAIVDGGGSAADVAVSDGSSGRADSDGAPRTSPCALPHIFCDDFDDGPIGVRWTSAAPYLEGAGATLEPSTTLHVSAPRSLHGRLPAAAPADTKKAYVAHSTPIDDQGLRYEVDVYVDEKGETENYAILSIQLDQGETGSASIGIFVDHGQIRISVQAENPTFKAFPVPGLPPRQWHHLVLDVRPNTTGDAILWRRPPNETSLVEIVRATDLTFTVTRSGPDRVARALLGVQRFNLPTPEIDVSYDNFTIDKRP